MSLWKSPCPVFPQDAECSRKPEYHQPALPDEPVQAQQPGGSMEKEINSVCQKCCHDQQTFPEPQPRVWFCQCTQCLRFWSQGWWARARVLWFGTRRAPCIYTRNPLVNGRPTIKQILNSMGFVSVRFMNRFLASFPWTFSTHLRTIKQIETAITCIYGALFFLKAQSFRIWAQCFLGNALPSSWRIHFTK